MGKRYIEEEELEKLFAEYAVPYTNILDEVKKLSAEEIMGQQTVSSLREALDNKPEVFAIQIWQRDDVYAAFRAEDINPSSEMIDKVMAEAQESIEDCSDNWDRLHKVIRGCM